MTNLLVLQSIPLQSRLYSWQPQSIQIENVVLKFPLATKKDNPDGATAKYLMLSIASV